MEGVQRALELILSLEVVHVLHERLVGVTIIEDDDCTRRVRLSITLAVRVRLQENRTSLGHVDTRSTAPSETTTTNRSNSGSEVNTHRTTIYLSKGNYNHILNVRSSGLLTHDIDLLSGPYSFMSYRGTTYCREPFTPIMSSILTSL